VNSKKDKSKLAAEKALLDVLESSEKSMKLTTLRELRKTKLTERMITALKIMLDREKDPEIGCAVVETLILGINRYHPIITEVIFNTLRLSNAQMQLAVIRSMKDNGSIVIEERLAVVFSAMLTEKETTEIRRAIVEMLAEKIDEYNPNLEKIILD